MKKSSIIRRLEMIQRSVEDISTQCDNLDEIIEDLIADLESEDHHEEEY